MLVSLFLAGCQASAEREAAKQLLREQPLALPAGLILEEYPIEPGVSLDPLQFTPRYGTMESLLEWRSAWRQDLYPINTIPEEMNYSMQATLGAGTLVATQFNDQDLGWSWIAVTLDGKEIYRVKTGSIVPINALRGLWAVGDSWVLEIALMTTYRVDTGNAISFQAFGQIIQDGVLLNQRLGYSDMFGYQLMAGRPFYFFKQNNLYGFAYAGQAVQAEYTEIYHYGRYGLSGMNPVSAKNMLAFFAKRADTLYYVEIGVYYPPYVPPESAVDH
mgnify:FL=1